MTPWEMGHQTGLTQGVMGDLHSIRALGENQYLVYEEGSGFSQI